MSYQPKLQLHPPSNWQDFELLCWGLWKEIWKDRTTQRNGRQGQPQHGVDVFGQPNTGVGWAGVQCKGKENFTSQTLSERDVTKEVKKAKKFTPRLAEYTIATTAPKDGELQLFVRKINGRLERSDWFRLSVCGWEDIEELLLEYEPPIAGRFYPLVFGDAVKGLLWKIATRLPDPSDGASASPTVPRFPVQGAPGKAGDVSQSVTTNGTPVNMLVETMTDCSPVRAKDALRALDLLAAIQEEIINQSGKGGTTSSDATLTSAVDRVVAASHAAGSVTDGKPR
jgi:hypothetical protein